MVPISLGWFRATTPVSLSHVKNEDIERNIGDHEQEEVLTVNLMLLRKNTTSFGIVPS
jgi:hypothetical protein